MYYHDIYFRNSKPLLEYNNIPLEWLQFDQAE